VGTGGTVLIKKFMTEILDIINMDDQVIGQATREDVYAQKHIHRIIHVIVRDSSGRQLLQLRSAESKYLPLHWSTAVGGHVHAGESYEDAARREMEEEIGITGSALREVGTFFYE
jgi:isopentenyldiphosphate isomerase